MPLQLKHKRNIPMSLTVYGHSRFPKEAAFADSVMEIL